MVLLRGYFDDSIGAGGDAYLALEGYLVVPTKQMTPFAPSPSGPTRCPFWENDGRMSGCRALEVYH
jgi:hypothetical protein